MIDILSFGAGVQSTCLLLMSCKGVLPKLHVAVFADTQAEPESVYAHMEWCKEQAAKAGIRLIIATAGNLRTDLIDFWRMRKSADGRRFASIPAFVKNPDGSRGMARRQCTGTYKIEVVEKAVREEILGLGRGQHWPRFPVIRQWIGISADEVQRRRRSNRMAIELHYPLLDVLTIKHHGELYERGYTRHDCLDWLEANSFPRPPRSACTFCPFHSDAEWASMKANDPKSFSDACEVDRLIRQGDDLRLPGQLIGKPYLHSQLIPLEMVEFKPSNDASEGRGMVNECQGMCGL